jgi:hypothetical protein
MRQLDQRCQDFKDQKGHIVGRVILVNARRWLPHKTRPRLFLLLTAKTNRPSTIQQWQRAAKENQIPGQKHPEN